MINEEVEDVCLDDKIPNLILQPVSENAIKHVVNVSTDAITITTDCAFENEELIIMISNNYFTGSLSYRVGREVFSSLSPYEPYAIVSHHSAQALLRLTYA